MSITERFQALAADVELRAGGRPVRILLAAKHQSPEAVAEALRAGADLLGHNRVQQLAASEEALAELGAPAHETHVIGHVQSNKMRDAVRFASTVESVDSIKTARRMDSVCSQEETPLTRDVFIQVNSSGAPSQFGIEPDRAGELADEIAALPHLRLTGLMTIGAHTEDESEIRASFATVRRLAEQLVAAGHDSCRQLSMGMSADYPIAVDEGATIIRVGSSIFGPRPIP